MEKPEQRESIKVLQECIQVQIKKSNDYQNPSSQIKQSDYYPNGCQTILDLIHAKTLRLRSVMEAMQNDQSYKPNFESLEDSAKDLINYASFFVTFLRGKMDGQDPDRDFLNRGLTPPKTFEIVTPPKILEIAERVTGDDYLGHEYTPGGASYFHGIRKKGE